MYGICSKDELEYKFAWQESPLNFLGDAGMRLRLDALEGSDPWDTDESSFNGSGSTRDTWNGAHSARCNEKHVRGRIKICQEVGDNF